MRGSNRWDRRHSGASGDCSLDTVLLFLLSSSDSCFRSHRNPNAAQELGAFPAMRWVLPVVPCPAQKLQRASSGCQRGSPAASPQRDSWVLPPRGQCGRERWPTCEQTHPSLRPQDTAELVSNSKKLDASCSPSASVSHGRPNK